MTATLRIVRDEDVAQDTQAAQVLGELFSRRQADETVKARAQDWKKWREFVGAASDEAAYRELVGYGRAHANAMMDSYADGMAEDGNAPNSQRRRIRTLTKVIRLAADYGFIEWTANAPKIAGDRVRDVRGPSPNEIARALAELAEDGSPIAIRDSAIIRLMSDLALRASSVSALDLKDWEPENRVLRVWQKRRHKDSREEFYVPESTSSAIEAWVQQRGSWPGPMFVLCEPGPRGEPFGHWTSTRATRQVVWDVTTKRGLGNPHGLRHTAITEANRYAAAHGLSPYDVAQFSGHSNVDSLRHYIHPEDSMQRRFAEAVANRGTR